MLSLKEKNRLAILHLSVLLGCVFPGGNIIGPLLVGSGRKASSLIKRQMANVVNFQILWSVLSLGILIVFWLCQFKRFSAGLGINTYPLKWISGFIVILALIYPFLVSIAVRLLKREKLFYPNLIRFLKVGSAD